MRVKFITKRADIYLVAQIYKAMDEYFAIEYPGAMPSVVDYYAYGARPSRETLEAMYGDLVRRTEGRHAG